MLAKVALLAAAVILLFTQVSSSYENVLAGSKKPLFDGYVYINGTKFYVNTMDSFNRHEAAALCETIRMKLIRLESYEKLEMLTSWFFANDYAGTMFWTDGIKQYDSFRWYWETTDTKIEEFFWAVDQPDYGFSWSYTMCICFYVDPERIGWDDALCGSGWIESVICE